MSEDFAPLSEGTATDIGKSMERVVMVGKELGLEAQLIQSAELVLRKVPAQRGSFDSMVTQQVDKKLGEAIAALAQQLASGEASKAERAGKVEDCNKQEDASKAHVYACREQLAAAKAALVDSEAALILAESSVRELGPEMEAAAADAEAADAVL